MNNNPFADLIPQHKQANPFSDLVPQRNPYNDEGPSWAEQPPMSGQEVLSRAVQNFPQSAANFALGQTQAMLNPVNVGRELGQIGLGQVWEGLKGRYGGIENIKRTIASDPVGAIADASILVPGIGARRAPALARSPAIPKSAVRAESELLKTGGARMQEAKTSAATVSAEDLQASLDAFNAGLRKRNLRIHDKLHPTARAVYDDLELAVKSPQTMEELHYLRQLADDVAAKPGTEGMIGQRLKATIDDMIAKHPEGSTFAVGKNEYARGKKSQLITEALEKARATAQWRRGDHAGAIRNAVKPLLTNKKYRNYWTKEERKLLQDVQRFTFLEGFGGFGSTGYAGFALGRAIETMFGVPGALFLPGYAARQSVNAAKEAALKGVAERVRAGGPVEATRLEKLQKLFSQEVFEHLMKDKVGARRIAAWAANPTAQTARVLAAYTSAKLNVPEMAERIISELQGLVPGYAEQEQKQ